MTLIFINHLKLGILKNLLFFSSFCIMYLDLQLMSQINIQNNIRFQRKIHFLGESFCELKMS
jgi:hypothetical protein